MTRYYSYCKCCANKKKNSNLFLTCLLVLLTLASCQSIESRDPLAEMIATADSVVLISHVLTAEHSPKPLLDYKIGDTVTQKEAKKYETLEAPTLLIDGKINEAIIVERKSLESNSKKELTAILISKTIDKEYNKRQCDMPHHTIVIYTNNTQSYIDICFACLTVHTSKDIKFSVMNMSLQQWRGLIEFFKTQGFTLTKNEDYE